MTDQARRHERQLVEAAKRGDERAFEALYHANRDFVLRVAIRFGAEGPDAHDVLQETFIYLVRKLPGLTLTARLSTLLYTVAKHSALKKKNTLRLVELPDDDCPARGTATPTTETDHTARIEAEQALARLGPEHREVAELRYLEEFTLQEISKAMDIPLGTVKSRLHKALLMMRQDE